MAVLKRLCNNNWICSHVQDAVYSRKIICSLSLSFIYSFIHWPMHTILTQLSTKRVFNGAMRKVFIKYTKLCPKNGYRTICRTVLWPINCLKHYGFGRCCGTRNHFRLSSIRLHLNSTHNLLTAIIIDLPFPILYTLYLAQFIFNCLPFIKCFMRLCSVRPVIFWF